MPHRGKKSCERPFPVRVKVTEVDTLPAYQEAAYTWFIQRLRNTILRRREDAARKERKPA